MRSLGSVPARDPLADAPATAPLRIGQWRVDPATDTIELDGEVRKLEPRTMRLLLVLASSPGKVWSGRALLDAVWAGVIVTDQSLYQAIGELRAVLRADDQTASYISTVPRKGYRLVAPVVCEGAGADAATSPLTPPAARSQLHTIAVLPFKAMGLAPALSFLPEMLLSGLIVELSRQPGLSPLSRGTMLSYGGTGASARKVAEDLAVRYVLDGTVTQLDRELHITCELVDTASAAVLVSESLQVDDAEWPLLTQHVIGRLARSARLHVSALAVQEVDTRGAESANALQLAMRAWVELYCRPQNRQTNDRAWRWAQDALKRDDAVGAAWNALAYCEWRAAQFGWSDRPWDALLADALVHAERAITLSPLDPDAYYTLGLATHTGGDFVRAEGSFRHCIEISASYAPAYGMLGLVRATRGAPEETAALCARAFALSPREPLRAVWHWAEACAASMMGEDEHALERATMGISANPDHPACYLVAAVSSWRLGSPEQARRYVAVLGRTAFSSVTRLRTVVPAMRVDPWASTFLADLHAAGLPAA